MGAVTPATSRAVLADQLGTVLTGAAALCVRWLVASSAGGGGGAR